MKQSELQICIDACLETLQDCERLIAERMGQPDYDECLRISRDCADICQLCVYLMLRRSAILERSCGICAEVCRLCAEQCERQTDALSLHCAETSRRCAELCDQLAASLAVSAKNS